MPYLSCPSCRLTLDGRRAYSLECCPRCLSAKGKRVRLEAHLGGLQREGRMVAAVRAELSSRDAGVQRSSPTA